MPWNRFKPSSKILYWQFQGGTSFVDFICFFCLVFVMPLCASVYLCLVVTCPGKGWPLGSHLWCITVSLSLSHWLLPATSHIYHTDLVMKASIYNIILMNSRSFSNGWGITSTTIIILYEALWHHTWTASVSQSHVYSLKYHLRPGP